MIEVVDLTKRFRDFTAVDHISFEVSAGEIFRFLGPNGAGKTTAIMMLTTPRLSHKNVLTPTHAFCHVFSADFQHI